MPTQRPGQLSGPAPDCQRHRGSRGGRHDHVRAAKKREQPSRARQDRPGEVGWQMAATGVRIDKPPRDRGNRRCRIDLVVLDLVAVALELYRAKEELGRRPSGPGICESGEPTRKVDEGDLHLRKARLPRGTVRIRCTASAHVSRRAFPRPPGR